MRKELEKTYEPKSFEDRTYQSWIQGGYFHAEPNPKKEPYTIVIPPPNITGQLHMGHALDNTIQDILIRFKRMNGFETLWIPGTDHASIATEAKIVEQMAKEGIRKEDLGREKFLEKAWEWKATHGGRIVEQLKKIGCSCDWDRERFTLDEGCSKAVQEVFVRLYERGLIHRGERIINWCPVCLTSISDAEVEHEEKEGSFWHITYALVDGSGSLEVATTRPETMLGDTALIVHPDDARYQSYIGKMVRIPMINREIPVLADTYVEMDFGTGVVKITPAHDPNDFEVGVRHNLPIINVMNEDATINENGGKYCGMDRYEARKAIVSDLAQAGFLPQIKEHTHNVGACYRCSTVVEPRISKQWFVKMDPLAAPAIDAVKSGKTKFVPERFEKTYFHWMENIKDWCISRQLWWGHRIPAYYCADCNEITVSRESCSTCSHCGSHNIKQDPDTLDTWFSSALWPFSTLGWPENTPELAYFYPTNTLVTGYDIIFFWVARMIFSGVDIMNETPFDTVYIHGIVRDAQGRKMSKSLGNGIEPLELIDVYGADALRFTLITGNSAGNDMRFSEEKLISSRNFANKIWNATRFILMNLDESITQVALPQTLSIEDKWVLSKYNTLVKEVTDLIEKFDLGTAAQKLYDFIWNILCDWYIELSKARLMTGGQTAKDASQILVFIMSNTLKLLHPFMPFITEEIWQALPHEGETIMKADYPVYNDALNFTSEEQDFEKIMQAIKAIRNRRSEMNVPPSKKANIYLKTQETQLFLDCTCFIQKLAFASEVQVSTDVNLSGAVQVITPDATIFIPMDQLIEKEKELERLNKEKEVCQKDIDFVSGKLSNAGFVAKAPANVLAAEQEKLAKAQEKMQKILESIASFAE